MESDESATVGVAGMPELPESDESETGGICGIAELAESAELTEFAESEARPTNSSERDAKKTLEVEI